MGSSPWKDLGISVSCKIQKTPTVLWGAAYGEVTSCQKSWQQVGTPMVVLVGSLLYLLQAPRSGFCVAVVPLISKITLQDMWAGGYAPSRVVRIGFNWDFAQAGGSVSSLTMQSYVGSIWDGAWAAPSAALPLERGCLLRSAYSPLLQISAYPHVLVEYVNAGIFPLS